MCTPPFGQSFCVHREAAEWALVIAAYVSEHGRWANVVEAPCERSAV